MTVAKKYQDELYAKKKSVEQFFLYFKPNYDQFQEFRRFVFDTSLTDDDITLLQTLQKPQLEFNILEAYVSRLRGEFSKQEPSINVRAVDGAPVHPHTEELVEGHIRAILFDANNDSFEYDVYTDLLSGGFSCMKVWTEYANERSFDQVIRVGRVYDPTMCGFDPMARLSHKGDGRHCYELFPKTKEEFKEEYPDINIDDLTFSRDIGGFNWSYQTNTEEILLICDFYEKKRKRTTLVKLANGRIMTADEYKEFLKRWQELGVIEQPPAIVQQRRADIETIVRYRFIENQMLEYTETNYKALPIVFADGNSVLLRVTPNGAVTQKTRPYVYHAKGIQKLKNFAGITLANELENMVQHKLMIPKEGIPPEYTDAYTNYQIPSVIVYNQYADDNMQKQLNPPNVVPRVPIPPEVTNTFSLSDEVTQAILGSYDAALGINKNQLSGVAIVEGATQSNSAAMPYVVGFLQALNQVAQIIVGLIPKYYVTPRTIPVIRPDGKRDYVRVNQANAPIFNYEDNALEVRVEAGVNFAIQKSRAVQQMIAAAQAMPVFGQFINAMGLEEFLDNLDIRGLDSLKKKAPAFMQMLQKQAMAAHQPPPPNPLMAAKIQQDNTRLQIDAQQNMVDNQLKAAQIANDADKNQIEREKLAMQANQAGLDSLVESKKADTERFGKAVDLALKATDQVHRHTKEAVELTHQLMMDNQPQETENV